MELKTEYIGLLAQAQRMVGTAAVETTAGFVGQLALINPEVRDKFDFDQAVDEYGDMQGCPPRLIVPDDEVEKKRAARQKQEAQMQAAAKAAAGAKVAKDLAASKVGQGSMLDKMAENPQLAAGAMPQ